MVSIFNDLNEQEMEEIKIEKLRQIVSRTDKTGNEKVDMLVEFAENYHNEQMQVKNINYDTVLETVACDNCEHECSKEASYCEACGNFL